MNNTLSWNFNNFFLCGYQDFYLLFDFFNSLFVNDAFDFVDDFSDLFASDLNVERNLHCLLHCYSVLNDSGFDSFFSHRHLDWNFLVVDKIDNFRNFDELWGGDEFVDRDRYYLFMDDRNDFLLFDDYFFDDLNIMWLFN